MEAMRNSFIQNFEKSLQGFLDSIPDEDLIFGHKGIIKDCKIKYHQLNEKNPYPNIRFIFNQPVVTIMRVSCGALRLG